VSPIASTQPQQMVGVSTIGIRATYRNLFGLVAPHNQIPKRKKTEVQMRYLLFTLQLSQDVFHGGWICHIRDFREFRAFLSRFEAIDDKTDGF
jgi:hypothetical protein